MGAPVPVDDMPDSIVPASDLPDAAGPAPGVDPQGGSDESVGRVAGLTGRALATGVADLPAAASSIAQIPNDQANAFTQMLGMDTTPKNAKGEAAPTPAADAPYSPQLSDFVHPDKWPQAAQFFADKAGLASPQTAGERVYSKAVEATPAAVLAPEAPITGALSAAAGGAASQATKEGGGTPLEQTAAGLAAGSVPALGAAAAGATVRGLVRGASGADMTAALKTAAETNTPLTVGQASGNTSIQTMEAASSKMWGGGPIGKVAAAQNASTGNTVGGIIDNLNQSGASLTPQSTGATIAAGGAAAIKSSRAADKANYDTLNAIVPPQTPIKVSNAVRTLDIATTPKPGAEASTAALVPDEITTMRNNLRTDIKNGTPALLQSTAPIDYANGTMPYSAVAALRTDLANNSIDWGFMPQNAVANRVKMNVWGALTDDLNAGAAAHSPAGAAAAAYAKAQFQANNTQRKLLAGVIDQNGGPEKVYAAATSGIGAKGGDSTIGPVMSALDPDSQNVVRATVLNKLGQLPAGAKGAGNFDMDRFLTGYGGMAPEAKDALFGTTGAPGSLRTSLDSISSTADTIRNAKQLSNPSGSAAAVGHGAGLWALMAAGSEAAGTFLHHPVAGAIAATSAVAPPILNNIMARVLTNPRTAAWLARSTKLPMSAVPNALNQLSNMAKQTNDPDAQDLSTYLYHQLHTQSAQASATAHAAGQTDAGQAHARAALSYLQQSGKPLSDDQIAQTGITQ